MHQIQLVIDGTYTIDLPWFVVMVMIVLILIGAEQIRR